MIIINYQAPGICPVCGKRLHIVKLSCDQCQTVLEGRFSSCKFCQLPPEQQEFIEVFVKCRGNIKDVEKELRISYPTVRNRLDGVIESLGYQIDKSAVADEKIRRQEILASLEQGEITPDEAVRQLKTVK